MGIRAKNWINTYTRNRIGLMAKARHLGGNDRDVEDIVQEAAMIGVERGRLNLISNWRYLILSAKRLYMSRERPRDNMHRTIDKSCDQGLRVDFSRAIKWFGHDTSVEIVDNPVNNKFKSDIAKKIRKWRNETNSN